MKQFTTEEQKAFFSTMNSDYTEMLNSAVLLDMVRPYIGKMCLEIGSGTGCFLLCFRDKYPGKSLIGIDIAPRTLFVRKGDCTSLDLPNKSYDTVFCFMVIEHLADNDLTKCISEIHRVLKDGGYAVFVTKNAEDLIKKTITCPECGCAFHYNGHCRSFTVHYLTKMLRLASFRIIKMKTLNIGYVASIGFLAKLFYLLRLQKVFKQKLFVGDIFCVVQKEPYWKNRTNRLWRSLNG